MSLGLKPLHDISPIKRIVVSTYQAVSGAGKEGIEELQNQVKEYAEGKEMTANLLPTGSAPKHFPIAFNLLPQIDVFLENDYTKEEMKMVNETHKILHDDTIQVVPTTVRVPVYRSHSESVLVETEEPVSAEAFRKACAAFPGLQVKDNPAEQEYPMPLYTSNQNDCEIGRIRKDLYNDKGMNFWIVGDQIRKGCCSKCIANRRILGRKGSILISIKGEKHMKTFGRVLTAMITSFNEDGSVNIENSVAIAEHLLNHGSDGLVVCGTTGENPTISRESKITLFKAIAETCGDKGTIIANVGSNDTKGSVDFVKEVSTIPGIDGLLVVVPYYNKPNQQGQYLHFKSIAEATTLPIMVYNVPGRVGTGIFPATLARLHKEYPHICAIKEASGNLMIASEIKRLMPGEDFMVYSGDDGLTLPILSVGGTGVISVVSHVAGQDMNDMIAAFEEGNNQKATQLHQKLAEITRAMFITTNPIPVKYAARKLGLPAGIFNLPMCEPSQEEAAYIDKALAEYLQ